MHRRLPNSSRAVALACLCGGGATWAAGVTASDQRSPEWPAVVGAGETQAQSRRQVLPPIQTWPLLSNPAAGHPRSESQVLAREPSAPADSLRTGLSFAFTAGATKGVAFEAFSWRDVPTSAPAVGASVHEGFDLGPATQAAHHRSDLEGVFVSSVGTEAAASFSGGHISLYDASSGPVAEPVMPGEMTLPPPHTPSKVSLPGTLALTALALSLLIGVRRPRSWVKEPQAPSR
jgi:hypothetical protein